MKVGEQNRRPNPLSEYFPSAHSKGMGLPRAKASRSCAHNPSRQRGRPSSLCISHLLHLWSWVEQRPADLLLTGKTDVQASIHPGGSAPASSEAFRPDVLSLRNPQVPGRLLPPSPYHPLSDKMYRDIQSVVWQQFGDQSVSRLKQERPPAGRSRRPSVWKHHELSHQASGEWQTGLEVGSFVTHCCPLLEFCHRR